MKPDKCPHVMSLESASAGDEDYKSEKEKNLYISCYYHNTPQHQAALWAV